MLLFLENIVDIVGKGEGRSFSSRCPFNSVGAKQRSPMEQLLAECGQDRVLAFDEFFTER